MNFLWPPGGRVVHVHHIVGPPGANGTQQFPKLTDYDLVRILNPLIVKNIIDVYCNEGGKERKAQCILANLKPIVEYAKGMFCKIETKHGYCSCECVAAIQRNQAAQGKLCDVVYRALMVCFTFADLQIQLDKIRTKSEAEDSNPPEPSAPTLQDDSADERLKALIKQWHDLHEECEKIHQIILHEAHRE